MTKHHLLTPDWHWQVSEQTSEYIHQWVKQQEGSGQPDLLLYGAPISRSSISASGASLYPQAFRQMWKKYATYNLDEDVDLTPYQVVDKGDVAMHTTNIALSHQNIEDTAHYLAKHYDGTTICMIGGDHSVTACAVRGRKAAHPERRIGILQFDTHLDVRDPKELGPANGTPIRQLIDGVVVKGEDVINIGLHGYFNTKSLVDYAKEQGITMVTLQQARRKGIVATIQQALATLQEKVDEIYVTVDMDVLDISNAPGVPASTTGGMLAAELFEVLLEVGKHEAVKAIDFVCLDPMRDSNVEETVKVGVYAWLQFVTGRVVG